MTVTSIGSPEGGAALAGTRVAALRGVRLPDGTVGDVFLDGADGAGVVADAAGPGAELDAAGWRVLPAPAEPHAHLDKALTAPRMRPGTGNDLGMAIEQWSAMRHTIDTADVSTRAVAAVRRYVAAGITAIRSHVDVPGPYDTGDPFRGVDALVALREELRGRVTLQVCLLPGSDVADEVLAEAAARGADVIGGCPHLAVDPQRELTRCLDLAERLGLPVDLHCDEQTDVELPDEHLDVVELARQTHARDLRGPVTASHAVRLGMLSPERLAPVVTQLAAARIGVVTLPITNLYLMGRTAGHAAPRGLTAVRALLDGGVTLAAGADNLRDPFNPAGRADPFETTSLLMTAGHLLPDESLHAVTAGARAVMGLPPAGTVPGAAADLVLLPDVDLGDVLAGGVGARLVVHAGRIIADTRVATAVDLQHPTPIPTQAR